MHVLLRSTFSKRPLPLASRRAAIAILFQAVLEYCILTVKLSTVSPSDSPLALSSAKSPRMHAVALGALRAARRPLSRPACRIIAGSRCPLPRRPRNFHRSAVAYRIPDGIPVPTELENAPAESSGNGPEESKADEDGTGPTDNATEADDAPTPVRKNGKTVSGRVRGNRLRQTEGLPPFNLPESFLDNNVKLAGASLNETLAIVKGKEIITAADEVEVKSAAETEGLPVDESEGGSSPVPKYGINFDIFQELVATLRAGLALRPPKNSNPNVPRPISKTTLVLIFSLVLCKPRRCELFAEST